MSLGHKSVVLLLLLSVSVALSLYWWYYFINFIVTNCVLIQKIGTGLLQSAISIVRICSSECFVCTSNLNEINSCQSQTWFVTFVRLIITIHIIESWKHNAYIIMSNHVILILPPFGKSTQVCHTLNATVVITVCGIVIKNGVYYYYSSTSIVVITHIPNARSEWPECCHL